MTVSPAPPHQLRRRSPTASEQGVLASRPGGGLRRVPPSPDLADLVERHWLVSWELPPGQNSSVSLLPHPAVNLVLDSGHLLIAGPGRQVFTYPVAGRGRVFGVKLRAGAFTRISGRPESQLTGRTLPGVEMLGVRAAALEQALARVTALGELVLVAETWLRRHRPAPDSRAELVGDLVAALLADPAIQRVDDLVGQSGIPLRKLQRLFRRYVGVPPTWVRQRHRLHEAAARLADGRSTRWADAAVELGHFDQSHFIRDFVRAVDMTPSAYAARCAADRARGAVWA